MNIGKMDTLLTVQTYTETKDRLGTPVISWSTYIQLWGQVVTKSGGEKVESDQKVGVQTVDVVCQRYSGITQKMRVYMLDVYYDILDVDYSDRQKVKMTLIKRDNQ